MKELRSFQNVRMDSDPCAIAGFQERFPLTPALSLRERENRTQRVDKSGASAPWTELERVLPLPEGEGRGEGEARVQCITRWNFSARTVVFVLVLAAVAQVFPALAAESAKAPAKTPRKIEDLFGDEVIARGKGLEIKRSQLDERVIQLKALNLGRGAAVPPDLEPQELQRLIGIELLLAKATEADKAKGEEMTVKRLETTRNRTGSAEALSRQLRSIGLSDEDYRKQIMEEATAESVVERELKISITDDDVKKFYDENPKNFDQPETVRVAHIQMNTRDVLTGDELTEEKKTAKRKQMEEILKRARAGEDFARLVKENSEAPAVKETGGELKFSRGQPGVPAEFDAAAFALKTNEVSEVVTTQYGYHIIKLLEKIPARKLELATVTPELRDFLKQRDLQKQLPDYVEKLKKEAGVQILDEKLKPREKPDAASSTRSGK